MIFLIDALALAFVAAIWSKEGALNIAIKMAYVAGTVINASMAAPFVMKWFS